MVVKISRRGPRGSANNNKRNNIILICNSIPLLVKDSVAVRLSLCLVALLIIISSSRFGRHSSISSPIIGVGSLFQAIVPDATTIDNNTTLFHAEKGTKNDERNLHTNNRNIRGSSAAPRIISDTVEQPTNMMKPDNIYFQTNDNHDWPGVPQDVPGHPLVQKGQVDFIANARQLFLQDLPEFLEIYKNRPDKVNLCGMRINHSYALWLTVKQLKPTAIIENGVNAGHSTYLMRAASPTAKIYPIDPLEEPICGQKERWMDTKNSQYYTGTTFQDFAAIDWGAKIKSGELDPTTTLVLIDDHLDPSYRYPTLLKHGFRHLLFEDNYKYRKGATQGDKAGWLPKQMFSKPNDVNGEFFWSITKRYAEFPPLVASTMAKDSTVPPKAAGGFLHVSDNLSDLVPPMLRPDRSADDKRIYEEDICKPLGIDPRLLDSDSYMQVMNYNQFAYLELKVMAPRLLEFWDKQY